MTTYAGLYGPEALIDGSGHPITSATIDVFAHGTTTHVSLYQDNARVTPLSNPVPNGVDGSTAGGGLDTFGNLSFYVDPGRYDLRIATGAGTRTVEIEVETDPAESGASSAGLTWPASPYTTGQTATKGNGYPMNATGGALTVAAPASPTVGDTFGVTKTDSSANAITITGTFEGQTNATITSQNAGATFTYLGGTTGWKITSAYSVTGPQGPQGVLGPTGPTGPIGPTGTAGAISQLQDEGSNLTVRPTINFVGAGVTATDDSANSRTLVTIPGGTVVPAFQVKSGFYISTPETAVYGAGSQIGFGYLGAHPIIVPGNITVAALGINLGVLSATANIRVGIYSDDGTMRPGSLVLDAGLIDCTATGYREVTGLSQALTAGIYWLATAQQGAGTLPQGYGTQHTIPIPAPSASLFNNKVFGVITGAGAITGALPGTFGAPSGYAINSGGGSIINRVILQVA